MTQGQTHEYRCDCGKLLFKSPYFLGRIEVKCRRCGFVKTFEEEADGRADTAVQQYLSFIKTQSSAA